VILLGDRLGAAAVLAARLVGRPVRPYVVTRGSWAPPELRKFVERLGYHLGVIDLPPDGLSADFVHLVTQHRARSRDLELGVVALHACEAVPETHVWLPLRDSGSAWPTLTRISRHHGKTLFNPFTGLNRELLIGRHRLESIVIGKKELPHDL
jgi:hypothetical protein